MQQQQTININQQLAFLLSSGKWRPCQRKKYNIFAIQPAGGYVFANRLEQPEQHKYMKSRFKRSIVHVSKLTEQDKAFLGDNCYITDGTKVVLCGTRGEMWTVKPEKLMSSYTKTDGTPITQMPKQWVEVSRAQEGAPSARGIQIPTKYLGVYQASWGQIVANHPASSGHFKGDILVISNDGNDVSVINNEVFANTFNLNVGGWSQSGTITPDGEKLKITLEQVREKLKFGNTDKARDWQVVEVHKYGSNVLWYSLLHRDGHKESKVDKGTLLGYIRNDQVNNARIQVYNGRNLVRFAKNSYVVVEEAVNTNVNAPESRKGAIAKVIAVWKKNPNGNPVGYSIDYKGRETKVNRDRLLGYVRENRISNARIQVYQGKEILRITDKDIPVRIIGETAEASNNSVKQQQTTVADRKLTEFDTDDGSGGTHRASIIYKSTPLK